MWDGFREFVFPTGSPEVAVLAGPGPRIGNQSSGRFFLHITLERDCRE